jgi:hypothetical protein
MRNSPRRQRVPRWARLSLQVDRGVSFCVRLYGVVRDEILLAWLSPEQLDALSGEYYGRCPDFLPNGQVYERGLFEWEERVFAAPPFPPSGRILVGAVGGGRELNELSRLGYSVTAFEPSAVLFESAREVAKSYPGSLVVQASYRDLVRAAAGETGPLQDALRGEPFGAVILGWGSISHVVHPQDRHDLLAAVRRVAPTAVVLISYLILDQPSTGKAEEFRLPLRSFLRGHISRSGDVGHVSHFSGGAFIHRFALGEIEKLAQAAGYDVATNHFRPYGHALLVPRGTDLVRMPA